MKLNFSKQAPANGTQALLRHCRTSAQAQRAALLVDACAYFETLERALRSARHSITVVGWDFDGRVRLRPEEDGGCALGPLLRELVEQHPDLHVRILVWSTAVLHGPSSPTELLLGADWQAHPRISLRLDRTHPFYASHHQKIVCIDGSLAFVGGIDLTVDRWDTPDHIAGDPRRVTPDGTPYDPVHDAVLMFEGEAAGSVCALAAARWKAATGEKVPSPPANRDAWPEHHAADFTDVTVGIACSMPAWWRRPRAGEAARLIAGLLTSARRSIYIEAQYLTADYVGDILRRRLEERGGPEIVAVVSDITHSWFERVIMGANRDRLVRRLRQADHEGRLRVFHPVSAGVDGGHCPILVHSKLMMADDRFLRVGSSNLNNRSIGLDSELDLAVEAQDAQDRAAMARLRDQLLGEHLGVSPQEVTRHIAETGSLIAAIDRLNGGPRRLRPFEPDMAGPTRPIPGTAVLDPAEPFSWPRLPRFSRLRQAVGEVRRRLHLSLAASTTSPKANGARK